MGRLVLSGGARPQKRRARAWSARKEQRFIEALTGTCNVSYAANEAGVSTSAVYRRRQTDATFRASWATAVSVGYSQLEMMLLERALHGVERPVSAKAGDRAVMRHYDDRTALALLKLHREGAAEAERQADTSEHEEAVERIIARLARLKERLEGAIETKSAGDDHAVLRWALGRVSRG